MNNRNHASPQDLKRLLEDELALLRKNINQIKPLLNKITTVRDDAYKRGFWFGVIVASTLFLAASIARVFVGL